MSSSALQAGSNDGAATEQSPQSQNGRRVNEGNAGDASADVRNGVAATLLTTLTAIAAALGAVGGLTGGIARMFRNHETQASAVVILIGFSIFLAMGAQLLQGTGRESIRNPPPNGAWARMRVHVQAVSTGSLVLLATLAFMAAVVWGSRLAVDTASIVNRPSLSAQMSKLPDGTWAVEGRAGASGLRAEKELQVYVYAVLAEGPGPDSRQLFFVTAGPDGDGIAEQTFDVPLPQGPSYVAFVVTANLGYLPRDCDGTAFEKSADPNAVVKAPDGDEAVRTACLTFTAPPRA